MRIYGVDLGTSTSAVAWAGPGGVQVVPCGGPGGAIPSAVCFLDEDHVVVGAAAEEEGAKRRRPVALDFKRALGGEASPTADGPLALSALVLRRLALGVARASPEEPLRDVVITHPQSFWAAQKEATVEAARLAGLRCVLAVSEPLAAAVDLAWDRAERPGVGLIVDLGGGTLDVNVIATGQGLRVLGSAGDVHLGGRDLDDLVLAMLDEGARANTGRSLLLEGAEGLAAARRQARALKIELQRRSEVRAALTVGGHAIELLLRRDQLEARAAGLMDRLEDALRAALDSAGLRAADIDEAVMVGGASRARMVEARVGALFPGRTRRSPHCELAVARGAARLGAQLAQQGGGALRIENRLPRTLGLLVEGEAGPAPWALVEAGRPLPSTQAADFETADDAADALEIALLEWPDGRPTAAEAVGALRVALPPGCPAGTPVRVELLVDLGGRVRVLAEVVGQRAEAHLGQDRGLAQLPAALRQRVATLRLVEPEAG